jgi:phosphatidylinositol alpha-1,6-mannosyltransferase
MSSALMQRTDLLMPVSDYTWIRFAQANPAISTLPHITVHLGLGEPVAATDLLPPDDRPIALMISRLDKSERYKGHTEVIECWPEVRAQLSDAELWIVGDGGLRRQLERAAGQGIRFWGIVSEQRKSDLIARSRALLMPSRKEGFGLVYLEAMRMGRPSLVSIFDAGREVIEPPDAGLAVDPADRPALTEAVLRMLRPGDEWMGWSRRARARYEAHYTARAYHRRIVAALESIPLA